MHGIWMVGVNFLPDSISIVPLFSQKIRICPLLHQDLYHWQRYRLSIGRVQTVASFSPDDSQDDSQDHSQRFTALSKKHVHLTRRLTILLTLVNKCWPTVIGLLRMADHPPPQPLPLLVHPLLLEEGWGVAGVGAPSADRSLAVWARAWPLHKGVGAVGQYRFLACPWCGPRWVPCSPPATSPARAGLRLVSHARSWRVAWYASESGGSRAGAQPGGLPLWRPCWCGCFICFPSFLASGCSDGAVSCPRCEP